MNLIKIEIAGNFSPETVKGIEQAVKAAVGTDVHVSTSFTAAGHELLTVRDLLELKDIPTRVKTCLKNEATLAGGGNWALDTLVSDLTKIPAGTMVRVPNFGRKTLRALAELLRTHGIPAPDSWEP